MRSRLAFAAAATALVLSCSSSAPPDPPADSGIPADGPATGRFDSAPPRDADAPDALVGDSRPVDRPRPDGPVAIDGRTADAAADAPPGVAFAAVQAIFAERCVRCHDPAHPFVPESPTFVALPLTPASARGALVDQPAHETCGGVLVTPGSPEKSYLFHKLTDEMPCDGVRMPHGGMLRPQPLPPADVATVAAWIRGGALP
jgi:hypothetical protein